MSDIKKMKKEARAGVLKIRDGMPEEERIRSSASISQRLFDFAPFIEAQTVMFFVSFRSEVLTEEMIRRAMRLGKRVVVPISKIADRTLIPTEIRDYGKELGEGAYGILEPLAEYVRPVDPGEIDFVAVPGSVFDRDGNRVGYGAGFYDRFRERIRHECCYAALAFSFQVVDSAPYEPHDKKVDYIITEKEIVDCRG